MRRILNEPQRLAAAVTLAIDDLGRADDALPVDTPICVAGTETQRDVLNTSSFKIFDSVLRRNLPSS